MTIDREFGSDSGSDRDIAAGLIRTAGRREQPPGEAYQRALRAATAAWQAKVRRRRHVMLVGWIAAGLAAVSSALLFDRYPGFEAPVRVGNVNRVVGDVVWQPDGEGQGSAVNGDSQVLTRGGTLRTYHGQAAITLDRGVSVRLAPATELLLETESRIRVREGKIYVDTALSPAGIRSIEVVTQAGTAWDVGTQFEVSYRDDVYRLRVRDGRVVLRRGDRAFDSRAGDQLVVTPAGELQRERIDLSGEAWAWAESLAQAPPIDERPLTVLLEWVARETGRPVRFESLEVKNAVARTILHGALSDMAPLEALGAILATTDFEYALPEDGTILIRSKRGTR